MKYLMAIIIFCSVLFFYLHIHFHLKTSNDLEVYTIERPSKEKLEEICDLRQPVTFTYNNDTLTAICNLDNINKDYGSFDINIRNNTDEDSDLTELYLPLQLNKVTELLHKDSESKYFTEENGDFLKETGLLRTFRHNDLFFRPHMVSKCEYDFSAGSNNCTTPLRYRLNYRNYIYVTQGEIKIKLIPPSGAKYLRAIEDYDNFEFRSPINVWDVQEEYKKDFGKVKVLELTLKQNDIIFIPAYWWYSIKYGENANICSFRYRTYMNTVAILPALVISTLQSLNTKHNIVQTIK
jgi:hypothetical protein